MRRVVAVCVLALSAGAWATPVAETVEIPTGFYTYSDLAERLSGPELRLRAGRDVTNRAALICLHARPRAEALAILGEALGFEVQLDTNRRSGALVQSARQKTKDRVWRGQVVERLKKDISDLLQATTRLGGMAEDTVTQMDAQATQDEIAYTKSLLGLSANEKEQRLAAFDSVSTFRHTTKLLMEWDLMAATRPILMQSLGNSGASLLTSDNRFTLTPIVNIGPAFMKAIGGYSNGLAWSHHEITHCLVGWDASLYNGRLGISPVVNLIGDRFVNLSNGSQIGCSLPGMPEVRANTDLVAALFGSRSAVFDRDSQAWYRGIDQASTDFLASEESASLRSRAYDSRRPFLSQALLDWCKLTNREVAMDLSTAAEGGRGGTNFAQRYYNWRFRSVQGVLAPVDLLGFWHRGRPLPMNALIPLLSPKAVDEVLPTESQVAAYYRATTAGPCQWFESFRRVPTYYGIRPEEIANGRESFMAWTDLHPVVMSQIKGAPEGSFTVPLARLSVQTLRAIIDAFRAQYPSLADLLNPTFPEELAKGNLAVNWKTEEGGKAVSLILTSNPETSAEGMLFDGCGSFMHFLIAQ